MKGTEFGMSAGADGGRIRVGVVLHLSQEGALLDGSHSTVEEDPRMWLLSGSSGAAPS